MDDKIDIALAYYSNKVERILKTVNTKTDLTVDEIIKYGEEMAKLEYKMTALEIAKVN